MEGFNPATMSDDVLFEACVGAIRRAAVGESQGGDPRSYNYAMELMAESQRRLTAAGHGSRCRSGAYTRAFEEATARHAGREPEPRLCTCAEAQR
jgi:hypothetical protein